MNGIHVINLNGKFSFGEGQGVWPHMNIAFGIGAMIISLIWAIGLYHLWQRQNASLIEARPAWPDRLFAIFWLPITLFALIATIPSLWRQKAPRREKY